MFDPEKVERFEEEGYGQEGRWVKIRVRASDYDQLLELYREASGQRAAREAQADAFFKKYGTPNGYSVTPEEAAPKH